MIHVAIQSGPLDPHREVDLLCADNTRIGGVVSFIGLMRDFNQDVSVERMYLEHYPGMTEKALRKIAEEAVARWELEGCRVVHRVGDILPGEPIVVVAVAAPHRQAAFMGCEFVIDYLKTQAPFWKKETTREGERWVEARVTDDQAQQRWGASKGDDH